jgi:NTP pyrophosphatase (non-canonical NTP hydrolase)
MPTNKDSLAELTRAMHEFVRSKGWYEPDTKRPQTPRNLAISLSLEANELLEHFQWHEDIKDKDALAGELADVMLYLMQIASITEIDLGEAVIQKLAANQNRGWDKD